MRRLRSILAIAAVCTSLCVALMAVVILVGLGVGYCLHHFVPGIDLGVATVIGVLALLLVVYAVLQLMELSARLPSVEGAGEATYADDEVLSDEQVEYVADQLTEAIQMKLGGSRRKGGHWSRASRQG